MLAAVGGAGAKLEIEGLDGGFIIDGNAVVVIPYGSIKKRFYPTYGITMKIINKFATS